MWNAWGYDECLSLFGEGLGPHIWDKYARYLQESWIGAPAALYADLDSDCRRRIAERAVMHYNH